MWHLTSPNDTQKGIYIVEPRGWVTKQNQKNKWRPRYTLYTRNTPWLTIRVDYEYDSWNSLHERSGIGSCFDVVGEDMSTVFGRRYTGQRHHDVKFNINREIESYAIGAPSIFKVIRSAAALARILSHLDFSYRTTCCDVWRTIKSTTFVTDEQNVVSLCPVEQ